MTQLCKSQAFPIFQADTSLFVGQGLLRFFEYTDLGTNTEKAPK